MSRRVCVCVCLVLVRNAFTGAVCAAYVVAGREGLY